MPDWNIGRNDPCPCGSGQRYRDCHGALRPGGSELGEIARAGLAQGDFHRRCGEHDAAIAAYEAAIAAGSEHPGLLNNLGLSLQALGRLRRAADRYREANARQPDLLAAHANLGDVLSARHRYAEGAASYARA